MIKTSFYGKVRSVAQAGGPILAKRARLSRTVTRAPSSLSSIAHRSPQGPAPTTQTRRPASRPHSAHGQLAGATRPEAATLRSGGLERIGHVALDLEHAAVGQRMRLLNTFQNGWAFCVHVDDSIVMSDTGPNRSSPGHSLNQMGYIPLDRLSAVIQEPVMESSAGSASTSAHLAMFPVKRFFNSSGAFLTCNQ